MAGTASQTLAVPGLTGFRGPTVEQVPRSFFRAQNLCRDRSGAAEVQGALMGNPTAVLGILRARLPALLPFVFHPCPPPGINASKTGKIRAEYTPNFSVLFRTFPPRTWRQFPEQLVQKELTQETGMRKTFPF
ncbi:MAG: hypothetical protein IMZ65_00560 [Planctomycetes bacterium]|nr:hypothetical protein [Planctomycetota bacterium]